jgi:hypothetical protein
MRVTLGLVRVGSAVPEHRQFGYTARVRILTMKIISCAGGK